MVSPVANTSTASATSIPWCAAAARPGRGTATLAAATTRTRASRKRSAPLAAAASAARGGRMPPPAGACGLPRRQRTRSPYRAAAGPGGAPDPAAKAGRGGEGRADGPGGEVRARRRGTGALRPGCTAPQQPLRVLMPASRQPDVIQVPPVLPGSAGTPRLPQRADAVADGLRIAVPLPHGRASTMSVTSPVSGSIPARHARPAMLAQIRPADHSRSLSRVTRRPPQRTPITPAGASVRGSRRMSSLVPSLVTTSSPAAQMPQPSRL